MVKNFISRKYYILLFHKINIMYDPIFIQGFQISDSGSAWYSPTAGTVIPKLCQITCRPLCQDICHVKNVFIRPSVLNDSKWSLATNDNCIVKSGKK